MVVSVKFFCSIR